MTMIAIYIAAAIASCFGILIAIIAADRALSIPRSLSPDEREWPYDEVDYLWWDEGIYWVTR